MVLQLASAGARVKAFIPALLGLAARAGKNSAAFKEPERHNTAERATAPSAVASIRLSAETKAALAPLDLPPDGPIGPGPTLRARLAPDIAARNFVSWARALDLTGDYSGRGIYALYCEFSEVDERPPLSSTRFLEALAQTEGIAKGQLRNGKVRRSWQWTIEPAKEAEAPKATPAHAKHSEPAPALCPVNATTAPTTAEPPASLLMPAKPARSAIVLPRFVADTDHPFSPAGLREGEKSARRQRLNAAAARKQRGALRRVA